MADNYFVSLYSVNCNDHTERKNGLTYLSWAWAWAEVKKLFPEATYTIYENNDGLFYHTDGKTCWVKTGVTINGIEHIEYLPVMDFKNKSIPANAVTSFDVNKAIQRSLTKACARHGLGLYIYAGEDLPEDPMDGLVETVKQHFGPEAIVDICECCHKDLEPYEFKGKKFSVSQHMELSKKKFDGHVFCRHCIETDMYKQVYKPKGEKE